MKHLKLFEEYDSVYTILYTLKDIFQEVDDLGYWCEVYTNSGIIYFSISKSSWTNRGGFDYTPIKSGIILEYADRAIEYMKSEGYEFDDDGASFQNARNLFNRPVQLVYYSDLVSNPDLDIEKILLKFKKPKSSAWKTQSY